MTSFLNIGCFCIIVIATLYSFIFPGIKQHFSPLPPSVAEWIADNNVAHLTPFIVKLDIPSLEELVETEDLPGASLKELEEFHEARSKLKKELILNYILSTKGLSSWVPRLKSAGIVSLERFAQVQKHPSETRDEDRGEEFLELYRTFPWDNEKLEELSDNIWSEIASLHNLPSYKASNFYKVAGFILSCMVIFLLMWQLFGMVKRRNRTGFFHLLTGRYLDVQGCLVQFQWEDPATVGTTVSFLIEFFQGNGRPYPISDADELLIEITQGIYKVGVLTEIGGTSEKEVSSARCKFTPRKTGCYKISITLADQHIGGSPFYKSFLAGQPDPSKIAIIQHCSTIICTAGVPHFLLVEPRDSYQNVCSFLGGAANIHDYGIHLKQTESDIEVNSSVSTTYDPTTKRIVVKLNLPSPGCYATKVTYREEILVNGSFDIIALAAEDAAKVQKTVLRRTHEGYEARLIAQNETSLAKPKKVYCFVTPKQLFVKEYILKLIPKRVCTFRLCPATKFKFTGINNICGLPTLHISDGCQPAVTIASKDRDMLAATFTQFMLKNIGGSETFRDKQDYFYHEVRRYHLKRPHDVVALAVSRSDLLKSSMKATKSFSLGDWCKNFEITFLGEEGLDWGGVRREWFELICASLFDPSASLFRSFHEGSQALVHPNPDRGKDFKLKYYEFAGRVVGKCLYESALGTSYRLMVRARFTRSFLAQLIGLRVHYKHFAHDDPDFYSGKILHLLECGVSSLGEPFFFTEDVVQANGQIKTVELKAGGSFFQVTDENLQEYLDCLAQFRLASQVKPEIEAFLSGLNEIIPDNLLCIFDENELELLMCGIEVYSITDFKENHVSSSTQPEFRRVLNWFWTAVSNFSEEEMARLLQFTTGCSRLPPGGFKHLSPPFQIAPSYTYGNLPTAHTCFNQLCLPDYDCYEDFVKAILFAIKEGSEGFTLV